MEDETVEKLVDKAYRMGTVKGLLIGLVLAAIMGAFAVQGFRGWADEARATNYYYSLTQSYVLPNN